MTIVYTSKRLTCSQLHTAYHSLCPKIKVSAYMSAVLDVIATGVVSFS